jgi:parallel beta-helix repeat protein
VSITDNHVIDNDKNLTGGTCPDLPPYFASGEAIDCGEGIHLSGVDHSTISSNIVEHNAGGILVADDVGPNHDNVITNNLVQNNKPDCGITLAAHNAGGAGVFRNTVAWNQSYGNGGAGVGIFAPGPGSQAYANKVLYNSLSGNAQPGVTMHNHAAPGVGGLPGFLPAVVFSDNVIVGNRIWKNAADNADATTSGPTGINLFSLAPMPGTIIEQNDIFDESLDVAFNVPAAPPGTPDIQVHSNDLLKPVGVQNTGSAVIDATQNWWGCSRGPSSRGCSSVQGNGVVFAPWLTRPNGSSQQRHDD